MSEEKVESNLLTEIKFLDKDGKEYLLSPTTYKHIKRDHCINDPASFIKDTLLKPFAIVEDKTKSDRWIYHKDYRDNLYKVVVVCISTLRIKTAFISRDVKGDKVLWISEDLIR